MTIEKAVILILMFYQSYLIVQYFRTKRAVRQRKQQNPLGYADISHLNLTPPDQLVPLIGEMLRLDMTRLGEIETTGATFNPPLRAWILVDEAHHTTCELFLQMNPDRPSTGGFGTMFLDKGYVLTNYRSPDSNRLRTVEHPDFRARSVDATLLETYRAHCQDVDDLKKRFGAPHPIHSIDDYFERVQVYMAQYYPRRKTGRRLSNEVLYAQYTALAQTVISVSLLTWALMASSAALRVALILAVMLVSTYSGWIIQHLLLNLFGRERLANL